jgi:hypothetical protein
MKQNEEIPDEIVRFIQVVSDDENLRNWILNLENIPNSVRYSELQKMGKKMKEINEDPSLIYLIESQNNKSAMNYYSVIHERN